MKILAVLSLMLVSSIASANCAGAGAIVANSKVFMTLSNGQKVAYSDQYGKRGTTKLRTKLSNTEVFAIGNRVDYKGELTQSICVPSVLTVSR